MQVSTQSPTQLGGRGYVLATGPVPLLPPRRIPAIPPPGTWAESLTDRAKPYRKPRHARHPCSSGFPLLRIRIDTHPIHAALLRFGAPVPYHSDTAQKPAARPRNRVGGRGGIAMSEDDGQLCPRCGRPVNRKHESACRAAHDSPFASTGWMHREGGETGTCAMCGQEYESYLDHLQECPAGQ